MNIIGLWNDQGTVAEATMQPNYFDYVIPRQDFSFDFKIEGSGDITADSLVVSIIYKIFCKHTGILLDDCSGSMHRQ